MNHTIIMLSRTKSPNHAGPPPFLTQRAAPQKAPTAHTPRQAGKHGGLEETGIGRLAEDGDPLALGPSAWNKSDPETSMEHGDRCRNPIVQFLKQPTERANRAKEPNMSVQASAMKCHWACQSFQTFNSTVKNLPNSIQC